MLPGGGRSGSIVDDDARAAQARARGGDDGSAEAAALSGEDAYAFWPRDLFPLVSPVWVCRLAVVSLWTITGVMFLCTTYVAYVVVAAVYGSVVPYVFDASERREQKSVCACAVCSSACVCVRACPARACVRACVCALPLRRAGCI